MNWVILAIIVMFGGLTIGSVYGGRQPQIEVSNDPPFNPRCTLQYYGLFWNLSGC
jgi:hypothetical protein